MTSRGMDDHPFTTILDECFGGVLSAGAHAPEDGAACALEVASIARGEDWSDDPLVARLPDIRPLNDTGWPTGAARTAAVVPLVLALWDWSEWGVPRRRAWATRVAERTIREVLPIILRAAGITAVAEYCEREGTRDAARAVVIATRIGAVRDAATYAALAADRATRDVATYVARYADAAAAYAALAAAYTVDDAALAAALACRMWTEEAA